MSAPAAPAPSKDTREKTSYVVLEKNGETGWTRVATISAANSEGAIRSYLPRATRAVDADEHGPSTYVAVPERSWKPVTVKTETKTVITLT